ncbi:hypothetical protein CTI12_AA228290 [Artemisia annua]|uniref:Uncharacterized protein n=1 Tax=Artemisia annua TaxID=35608 RepID=A0A2U1NNL7_ARTAN|nr:hypothetical protein CTI12_AA228290 [Artemisia annua]
MAESDDDNTVLKPYLSPAKKKNKKHLKIRFQVYSYDLNNYFTISYYHICKGKKIVDVDKVISSLPFLKTSTKGKKAAKAHVVDVEEMEIEEEADDKKKKKKHIIKEEPPASPQRVKGRLSPKAMSDAMVGLTEMRKKSLKDIGFERFINFPITELPEALLYYVVDKFHPTSMELRLEKGSIKITKQRIHDMIGVSMGKTKLEDLEQRDPDDPFIAEWESQYSNVAKITPAAISTEITSTFDADFIFTINFLTLYASTMGKVDNGAKVYRTVLQHVKENDVISDIDWCGYILECLRTSRHNWEKLLYLDSTNFTKFQVMRHRPTMRSWNTQAMRKRIGMEIKDNCLGKLEHHEEFDPEEEQTGLNFYKGTDVYTEPLPPKRPETKEEFVDKIEEKFENISNEKAELAETLKEGMQKFKGDKTLFSLCKKYKKMFNVLDFDLNEEEKKDEENESDDGDTDDDDSDDDGGADDESDDGKDNDGSERATQTKERKTKNTARKSVTPPEKMITTRSKMKSISPPSFSLGISPPSNKPAAQTDTTTVEVTPQVEKRATVETDTTTSEPKPKMEKRARKIVVEKENKEQEPLAKRIKRPSRYLVSPYNNRKTVLKAPQTPDESIVSEALFSMQGDPYEFVFETEWAWGAATIRDNMQTLAPQLKMDMTRQCIKWNCKGTSVIIDNSPKAYDAKYKKESDVLKKLFSRYLASHNHEKAVEIASKNTTVMKKYDGETAKNWNLELPKEGREQEIEIIKIRIKYATKMLMHELNIHREKMSEEAFEFARKYTDKAMKQEMIREEIEKKKKEQAAERVASAK